MFTAPVTWRDSFDHLLNWVYPCKCALCGLLMDASPCGTCQAEMRRHAVLTTSEPEGELDFRTSIFLYEGRSSQAVRRLKYSRSTSLVPFMAREIAEGIRQIRFKGIIVPVPIHWIRRNQRGFNQSEFLCRDVASDPSVLERIRPTRPQVGLNAEERRRNLAGAFRATRDLTGESILLVDDVVTSGVTARECARALRARGALDVGVLAFCGDSSDTTMSW